MKLTFLALALTATQASSLASFAKSTKPFTKPALAQNKAAYMNNLKDQMVLAQTKQDLDDYIIDITRADLI